jgi:uncharacterized repeat protein (TIGR01451 family)
MRTTRHLRGARWRPLRSTRLALAGLVAVAALVVPGLASAATHKGSVSSIYVAPSLMGTNNGGFGLYNFTIASDSPAVFPFAGGPKQGHCVEATQSAGKNPTTLNTEADLTLGNANNSIGTGFTVGAQRVEWILLSSYKNSKTNVGEAAAHQSAIWHLTNPNSPQVINIAVNGTSTADRKTQSDAAAESAQLLTDSATYYASVKNAADLSVDGGATLQTCAGTNRTVTVTGSPFTDATLTLSGSGTFVNGGGATTTVNLGATGTAQVEIHSTGAGSIDVPANVKIATMVQADNGGSQNFVYLEFQTVSKKVTLTFKNCQDLTVTKTAVPTVDRAFTWTIVKSVVGPDTKTADAGTSVGFDYNVVVTKSAPVDANWKVAGTISVTNPNAFDVTGTVSDDILAEGADTCVITGGATKTFLAGKTTAVPYTCSFSGKPSYAQLTNHASVTWLKSGFTTNTVNTGDATFQFGTGTAGNPSATHDGIDVFDAFNGGAPVLLGNTTASKTFAVHKDILVPSGVSGCVNVDNTATFTDKNPNNTPSNSSSVTTHVCVAGHDLTIKKTVTPSYTRTYTWTIEKKVNGKDSDGPISSDQPTVPAHYTVVTTKTGANHDFKLAGTITVTNPNSFAVSGASVTDQAPAGFACVTVPANGALGSIAAGASVTVNYTCSYSGSTAPTTGTNHATVNWTAAGIPNNSTGHTSAGIDASFDFANATVTVEHNAVDVIDSNVANPLATNVTAGNTYTYDLNVPVPNIGCTTTPNTAMVTDTGQPASVLDQDTATIQLCRTQKGLALAKTAEPGFTRAFDWTISKSVDQTSVTTAADTATFNYTVVATKSAATDSGWKVTGTISVTNPNAYTVTDVVVTEQGVDNGGVCTLKGSGALGTLVQGQTSTVDYTCTYALLPAPAAGTNTAKVTWTLPAGSAPTEPTSGTVTQAFVFGAPTTTVHDAVNVGDLFNGGAPATLDGGANITASKTFTYARTVAVPPSGCLAYNNTANVTATDVPGYSKDATASVTVCRETPPTPPAPPVVPKRTVTPPVGPAAVPSKTTISLTKRASSPTVKAGGTVGFTIKWKNTGKATAKNVVICDDLPNQLTFVTAKGATFKNGKACWKRKSVAKGTTLTFRVVARVDASVGNEKLVNVATATASNAKPATAKAPVRALRNARTRAGGVTG